MANTNSAVLLFKKESVFRTDPVPTPGANAMVITEPPSFNPEVNRIQRQVARASLSKLPGRTGRITSAFDFVHEVMGSGVTDGSAGPPMDHLLQTCGMARTDFVTSGMIAYWSRPGNVGAITFVSAGAYTLNYVRYYLLTATVGGGSGAASFTVTAPAYDLPDGTTLAAVNVTTAVMTNSAAFTIANGLTITPTFVTNVAIGDKFVVMAGPAGNLYTPVSTAFASGTAYIYYEGLLHKSLGMRGSWNLEASAAETAKFTFSMTGDWADPTDAALPSGVVITDRVPPIFEFANIRVDNNLAACPVAVSVDLGNEVNYKECANAAMGYAGGLITGRSPTISFDPEFGPEATYPFWARLRNATEVDLSFNIGTVRGNMMHVHSHVQFTSAQYGDRNNTRTYEIEAEAVSRAGDDEIFLYFY